MPFTLPDLDQDTLHELSDTILEALDDIEIAMENLSAHPNSEVILNNLFRALHSVKGNFRMCLLNPFSDYMHGIEETFSEIREGRIAFSPLLKEVTLVALDKLRGNFARIQRAGQIDTEEMHTIARCFLGIATTEVAQVDHYARELLRIMAGNTTEELLLAVEIPECGKPEIAVVNIQGLDNDLHYFQALSFLLDNRIPYWSGRTQRLLGLVATLLPYLEQTLNRAQLHVAVYLHDLGMALVPDNILNQSEKLSAQQHAAIAHHPHISHQLLQRLAGWPEAAQIVLQHHERIDGTGYPSGLRGEQICYGARVLAVLDAFYSLTSRRADRNHRRSVLRALMEINNHAGTQFDTDIVKALTTMSGDVYKRV